MAEHLEKQLGVSLIHNATGSGCGLVGRAVASDTRDPQFESRPQQTFI